MPKESRAKTTRRHAPAVQLPSKRSFAAAQASEVVLPGSGLEAATTSLAASTGAGIFGISTPVEPIAGPSKRADFVAQVRAAADPTHPYSRSHRKRENKKARQRLAGGGMDDVASALKVAAGVEMEQDDGATHPSVSRPGKGEGIGASASASTGKAGRGKHAVEAKSAASSSAPGVIGEGKGLGMKERKKRKQIAIEARRIPAIMQHPAYKADPWATIRLHAANTLELRPVVGTEAEAKRAAAGAGAGAVQGEVNMDG